MTDEQRRYLDAFIRINQFGIDDGSLFPPMGTTTFTHIGTVIDGAQATGGDQMSSIGDFGEQFLLKGLKREEMRAYVADTSRTAKSMRYAFPGIEEQFAMPVDRSDAGMLNTARAFVTNGTPLQADFTAFGLDSKWFIFMGAAADAFEATFGPSASAQADRAETTADMQDWLVQGMRDRRILDGIAKNIFANNPGKLAAWRQASHIERPPKKQPTPTPPTPPTPPDPADDPTP